VQTLSNRRAYVKLDVCRGDVGLYRRHSSMATKRTLQVIFGQRCRTLRLERGLSQMDMVRRFDLSLSHYQKLERGALDPRLSTLKKLSKSFSVSISELLSGV